MHVFYFQLLYGEVQVNEFEQVQVVVTWGPPEQADGQTLLKPLPSRNFVGEQ